MFAAFIAPERRASPMASVATDLFAVGALVFWMLTGNAPPLVSGPGLTQTLQAALRSQRPALSPGVAHLVVELLEYYPSLRAESAASVLARLAPFVSNMAGQRSPLPSLDSEHKMVAHTTVLIAAPAEMKLDATAGYDPTPVAGPPSRRPSSWRWAALSACAVAGLAVWLRPVHHAVTAPDLSGPPSATRFAMGARDLQDWGHGCTVRYGSNTVVSSPRWDGARFSVLLFKGSMRVACTGTAGVDVHVGQRNVVSIDTDSEARVDMATARIHCERGAVRLLFAGRSRDIAPSHDATLLGGSAAYR
jgi:ferric-dicitrate binding protein FerR (iron transport regulator)